MSPGMVLTMGEAAVFVLVGIGIVWLLFFSDRGPR
jgi:hypothetical protein